MLDHESITVIIPTYNEAENIAGVLKRCINSLEAVDVDYEILVIDDASTDCTAEIAKNLLGEKGRVISRISDKKSLSLSVLEGLKESKGNIIIVMDGDGNHPPELIPIFIQELHHGYDLVIASRYCAGGGTESFPFTRKVISRLACFVGRLLTGVKDNTSGFFCLRKNTLENIKLVPSGFKIGLEIFVKANFKTFKETPYIFVNRKKGKSKFNLKPVIQYIYHVLSLLVYKTFKGRDDTF